MTHINTPGEMECYLEDEFCVFELTFTRGNTASCTELIAVEVNGNVYNLSSSINILAGNAMPPVAEQIESAIEEALDAYGLFGEASVTISFHLFPSPPHRKFTITVTNSNASSLKLLFEGCVKPEEFTKAEDCCEPGAAPVAGDGGLLGPGNPDLFYEHITYNGLDISRIDMGSNCMTGFMRNEYKYDANHRLTDVRNTFFMPEPVVGLFSSNYTYDLAGNLLTLKRFGLEDPAVMGTSPVLIDNLDYVYPTGSSVLTSVEDLLQNPNVQPFGFTPKLSVHTHDGAGNLIKREDGASIGTLDIDYNLLNLPGTITHPTDGAIRYGYTFGGHKFLKTTELADEDEETRLYLGGAEFVEGQPESYYHGEGRVALTGSEPRFQYKLTDHLGNTMVLFEDINGDGIITTESMNSNDPVEVLQRNFYYAFGLPMQGPWNHAPADPDMPYLYNGKELEGELGLGWYAYGFRYYDASVGRFVGVDPIADQFPHVSVFNYAENRVPNAIDLWGLQAYIVAQNSNTVTIQANFYYNKNEKIINWRLNNPGYEGNMSLIGLASQSFQSRVVNVDGVDWTVNFEVAFHGVDSYSDVVNAVTNDQTGSSAAIVAPLGGSNAYNDGAKTIELGSPRGDGTTVAHEAGHFFGLPHSSLIPGSPYFGSCDGSASCEDGLANTSGLPNGPLMFYDNVRSFQDYEISYLINHVLKVAAGQSGTFTNYHSNRFSEYWGLMPLAQYQQSLGNRASEIRSYFETLPKRKDE